CGMQSQYCRAHSWKQLSPQSLHGLICVSSVPRFIGILENNPMRHFLPLVFLLIVVAPVKADQKWYFLDKEAVEEAYDKVTCQQGPDVIRNRLQADDKKPEGEKMSGLYRNALQACLNRIAAGEKFDLDISVRNRLIAGLRVVKPLKLCRENEV